MREAGSRDWLRFAAALSGALAIGAGAFGAHGAGSEQAANWLRTGGMYQLVHAVAVLALAGSHRRIGWLWLAGAGLFGATLYLMALGGPRWLGAVTPVGGVMMIVGWVMLACSTLRAPR
jgi:uncharacterized membrane protein YgdD (TMEM256/DUF423 family)